jgi:hypothetical protein
VSGQRDGPPETRAEPHGLGGQLSRRGFLGGGSAAVAATVIGVHPAAPDRSASLDTERRMIVQLARAGTGFPVRLPTRDQAGGVRAQRALGRLRAAQRQLGPGLLQLGAARRPSLARLRAAEQALPAGDLVAARRGADLLIGAGLLDSSQRPLLAGLGHLAATARPPDRAALVGAATLAVRTVFSDATHPRVRTAAAQWVNLLSAMHEQGTLRPATGPRELR